MRVTLTPHPTSEEETCLYYYTPNGSIMKGFIGDKARGGWAGADGATDGFARPPGNVNVCWELWV